MGWKVSLECTRWWLLETRETNAVTLAHNGLRGVLGLLHKRQNNGLINYRSCENQNIAKPSTKQTSWKLW